MPKEAIAAVKPNTIIAIGEPVAGGIEQLAVELETVHCPAYDTRGWFPAGIRAIFDRL